MQYAVAFAAIAAVAQASTMIPLPPSYGGEGSVTTSKPAVPEASTSTAFVTDEITVISCGPEVTNCPGKSTTVKISTTAAPPPPPKTTEVKVSTSAAPPPPPKTSEVKVSSTVIAPPPPPETTPVATHSTSAAPPPPPPPMISTEAITTCVPTTIYKTVTVAQTTPVATSKAPYATGNPGPYASGAASGTGVVPKPSSSPIVSSNGAADLTASFGGMALAAMAAVLFA